MANKGVLLVILQDLESKELKSFIWNLINGVERFDRIPKGLLEDADREDIVDKMVEKYGISGAEEITLIILKKINQNQLAEELKIKLSREMADVSSVSDVLQKVLENLNAEDLRELQNHLALGTTAKFPAIAKSAVLGATVQATVREMLQVYGLKNAVEVCEINLKTMKHSILAQSLGGIKGLLWMTTPSAYVLNDVLSENMSITIPVHVKPNAKMFSIDVMKDDDIYFHLRPYFTGDGKGRLIVRNSLIGGVWGSEERETLSFPFVHGKSFLVKILCAEKEFKVYVDDAHLLNFTYRGFDFTKINKVRVRQDVITWDLTVK